MQNISEYLIQNNLLKTKDELSFAKYIAYKPMTKNKIIIQSNALIYVIKGTKILHLADEDRIIKAGDIFFIKSGSYIMSEVLDEIYEGLLFFYSDTLLNQFIKKYEVKFRLKDITNDVFVIKSNSILQNGLLSIISYFENENMDSNIVKLKFEEIFLNLVNDNEDFVAFLKHIYIQNNLDFKIKVETNFHKYETIKELAKYFKMSELNFRSKFKETFNKTPKKWIVHKRLKKAKVLLEQSELNVSEVCYEVGFDNISWFIQSFKKEFGITPKKQKLTKIK